MNHDYRITFDRKVTGFKRNLLREQLKECTEVQQDFFNRLYGGIDEIHDEMMRQAYQQVCRTVAVNEGVNG